MFNSIKGLLTKKELAAICVDTGSLEWKILMPSKMIEKMGAVNSEVKVFLWLHHHEDIMALYGFSSESERTLFLDLIKVNGVGPKQALRILSGISADELRLALENNDLAKIKTAPGIGQKTAQKILLALQGKLTSSSDFDNAEKNRAFSELIDGLTDMGFDKKKVASCVSEIVKKRKAENALLDEADIFREAIVALSS
ncbi:MAG: Holliday junction branch migration protein RuvA [Treponema sp.]|nr:MAG: Holliday junction branch migration protein RuvA [Treponema sp.]